MQEIQSENVAGLMHATKTKSNYYLVMQHCNGGDLQHFIRARGGYLSEAEAKMILRQIVNGLLAIKDQNVMHRDLKLANILVNFPGLAKEEWDQPEFSLKDYISEVKLLGQESTEVQVKIADLGFARRLKDGDLASTRLGTPLIMAPEVLDGNQYDHKADVWSLGCIFYELLVGFSVFTGTSQANLAENITRGIYFFPKTCKLSITGLSFMNACLQYHYNERMSLQDLA